MKLLSRKTITEGKANNDGKPPTKYCRSKEKNDYNESMSKKWIIINVRVVAELNCIHVVEQWKCIFFILFRYSLRILNWLATKRRIKNKLDNHIPYKGPLTVRLRRNVWQGATNAAPPRAFLPQRSRRIEWHRPYYPWILLPVYFRKIT